MDKNILSHRLETVASFVPSGARLLDVGSDHAYLPLALVEKGQLAFAVAGEVVEGPYQSALANVREAGREEQIIVRLANGLAAWEEADQVDTITICGMGGRLIADILEAGKERLVSINRLILQPNNREDELRDWLVENGFALVAEEILTENGKFYEILVAEKGQMTLTALTRRFGPFLSQEVSSVFRDKWSREAEKLAAILQHIPQDKKEERAVLQEKITLIKEVLDNEGA